MATDRQLYELHCAGQTYTQIANDLSLSVCSVRSRVSRYRRKHFDSIQTAAPTCFTISPEDRPAFAQVNYVKATPKAAGDALILSDIHVPTTDWHLLHLACAFARRHMPAGKRRLCLIGDLFNFDALGKHDTIMPQTSIEDEMKVAEYTLAYMLDTFDMIDFVMGNHDDRFMRHMHGQLTADRFSKMLTRIDYGARLKFYGVYQMWLMSGGVSWRLTHQRPYSVYVGAVADELARKYQTNIVTTHEHHVGVGRTRDNRYTWIANGSLMDYESAYYVGGRDTKGLVMKQGFTFIRDGVGHLLTPYPTMTDWSLWGMQADAQMAIASAQARVDRMTGHKVLEEMEA